jgi:hypothetical protein
MQFQKSSGICQQGTGSIRILVCGRASIRLFYSSLLYVVSSAKQWVKCSVAQGWALVSGRLSVQEWASSICPI